MAGKKGQRDFGRIRKLPSGRFQASYIDPTTQKRVNAPTTFALKKQASAWLSKVRSGIEEGVAQSPHTSMTVAEFADGWTLRYRTRQGGPISYNTEKEYDRQIRLRILPYLGDKHLQKITSEVIQEWYLTVGNEFGMSQRAHAYRVLNTMLNDAVHKNMLRTNPCAIPGGGKDPKPKKIAVALEPSQIDALADEILPHYRALVYVAAYGSLRFSEATSLRRKDVANLVRVRRSKYWNQEKHEWVFKGTKSNAGERGLHLPGFVYDELKLHLKEFTGESEDSLIFETRDKTPIAKGTFNTALKKAAQKANKKTSRKQGVKKVVVPPHLSSHDLRHTGATLFLRAGGTVRELMERCGWVSMETALRYLHASQQRDKTVTDAMGVMARGDTQSTC